MQNRQPFVEVKQQTDTGVDEYRYFSIADPDLDFLEETDVGEKTI